MTTLELVKTETTDLEPSMIHSLVKRLENHYSATLTLWNQTKRLLWDGIIQRTEELMLDFSTLNGELQMTGYNADSNQMMRIYQNSTEDLLSLTAQFATQQKLLNSLNPAISYLSFASNGQI